MSTDVVEEIVEYLDPSSQLQFLLVNSKIKPYVEAVQKRAFSKSCQKIENDANFRPNITPWELYLLAKQNHQKSPDTYLKISTVLKHSIISTEKGKIYETIIPRIKENLWTIQGSSNKPERLTWWFDESMVILIKKNGEITLHEKIKAQKQDFSSPITHAKLEDLLAGSPPKEEQTPALPRP